MLRDKGLRGLPLCELWISVRDKPIDRRRPARPTTRPGPSLHVDLPFGATYQVGDRGIDNSGRLVAQS